MSEKEEQVNKAKNAHGSACHSSPGPQKLTNLNVVSSTVPNLNGVYLMWFSHGYC